MMVFIKSQKLPALSNRVTVSICEVHAAKCNAVLPIASRWLGSAPCCKSNLQKSMKNVMNNKISFPNFKIQQV